MSSLSKLDLGNSIFTIRGYQVMIDRDLADLYRVEVKRINEQVKRNIVEKTGMLTTPKRSILTSYFHLPKITI
jgi:hypothetical protein